MAQALPSVLWNADLVVNSVDLSGKCRKLTFKTSQEKKEVTAFGQPARNYIPGMLNLSLEAEFYLDRTTGGVVQTLRPLVTGPGSTAGIVPVSCRALNSAASTSNEVYATTMIIDGDLPLINGAVGDAETITVKFACASTQSFTVSTTS